jgi:UrcA family protein
MNGMTGISPFEGALGGIAMARTAVVAVAMSLALGATASHAQSAEPAADGRADVNHRTVRITDRDLSSAAGARRLALRIKVAAIDVCGGDNAMVRASPAFHDCVRGAVARAEANLGAAPVTAALGPTPQLSERAHP